MPMFVVRIAKVLENVLESREILAMNEEVQIIHLAGRAITIQLFGQHRSTNRNRGNALLFTRSQNVSEFYYQEQMPGCVLDYLLLQSI